MRPSCIDCARKHVSQAEVLMSEALKGYPEHAWLAIGHLAEAEDEMLAEYPGMVEIIRSHRLKYIEGVTGVSDHYHFPTIDIIKAITDLDISNQELELPNEIPTDDLGADPAPVEQPLPPAATTKWQSAV